MKMVKIQIQLLLITVLVDILQKKEEQEHNIIKLMEVVLKITIYPLIKHYMQNGQVLL